MMTLAELKEQVIASLTNAMGLHTSDDADVEPYQVAVKQTGYLVGRRTSRIELVVEFTLPGGAPSP